MQVGCPLPFSHDFNVTEELTLQDFRCQPKSRAQLSAPHLQPPEQNSGSPPPQRFSCLAVPIPVNGTVAHQLLKRQSPPSPSSSDASHTDQKNQGVEGTPVRLHVRDGQELRGVRMLPLGQGVGTGQGEDEGTSGGLTASVS